MTEAISNPQQQKLIDEFGRFELNKVEINEVAQYVLIKKLLETKGKDIKSLLPQILLDQLEDDKYDFFSGTTYYTDSSENETPESTNEIINYFTSKKYSENLLKINNKDIASLVSHVRFSRVPKENNKPVFKNATEISFSTHYNKSSLNNILQDAAGCGLSSLKVDVISNTGAYYAYKITMNLFFSNARILAEQEKYRLLLTTPTKDDNKKPVVYSLLFGWANPSVAKENQNTKDLYEENICLLLNLINYELGFQPDGSVTLSLNFIGAAESEIDGLNSDVLIDKFQIDQQTEVLNQEVNNAKKSLEDSLAHFRQTTQSLEKLIAESETKIANGADDSEKKNLEYFKQEITSGNEATQVQALQEQVRKITEEKTSQILNLKYTSFLTKLYDYNIVYQGKAEFETSLKESTIRFSATDVARKQAGAGVGGLGRVGATFTSADVATVSKIIERARKIDEAKQTDLSVAEQELIDAFTDTGYRQFATSGKTLFDETVRQGKDGPPVPYGAVYFNYIFVGDIIGVAASNAYHNLASDPNDKSPEDNFKIVLGTLDLEQTKTTYTQDLQNFVSTTFNMLGNEEKTTITLDIASIPIAYNVFTSWFLKNIVAKNVQTYPFNQFVKEFFQDCVLKVIQSYSSWESKFKTKTFESNSSTTTSIVKAFADESIEVYYTDMPYVLEDVIGSKRIDTSQIKDIFQDEKRRKKINSK